MDQIKKNLEFFLEEKRAQLARFYFISNDELLELIANQHEYLDIARHITKLFEALHDLAFVEPSMPGAAPEDIEALVSAEGEKLDFSFPVRIRGFSVEIWLAKIEEQMQMTLQKRIKNAHFLLNRDFGTDGFSKEEWIFNHCAQAVTIASLVYWTE